VLLGNFPPICLSVNPGLGLWYTGRAAPELHIRLNLQELLEANSPRLSGSSLEHESTKLRVEHRERVRPVLQSALGKSQENQLLGVLLLGVLDGRDASSLGGKLLIGSQGLQNIGLAERQQDLGTVLGIRDDQILDLPGG
jgi:hypothetical protein